MIGQQLFGFGRDQRGVSAVEFALLVPLLLMVLLGSVTVFDLFRAAQSAEKGTYTIGDMLSRQTLVTTSLLTSMLTFLTKTVDLDGDARLRVSSISNINGALVVDWSETVGNNAVSVGTIDITLIPAMAVGDSVIFTETFIPHQALVPGFGLDQIVYTNKSAQRPRFVGRISFQ